MRQIWTLFFIINLFYNISYAADIANNTTALQHINQQIKHIQTTITNEQHQQTDIQQQLKSTEISLALLSQDIARLNQSLVSEQIELSHLKKQQNTIVTKLAKQRDQLAQQVRAAYRLGKLNELKILLNQENPNKLSRQFGYYRFLAKERVALITTTQQTLVTLTHTMDDIAQHQTALQNLLAQKQQQQHLQQSTQTLRLELMDKLNKKLQTKQQRLTSLMDNQIALQQAINQLETQSISLPKNLAFYQLQGKLPWPVKGNITATFGQVEIGTQHLTGVILQAPLGTPVRAISSGKVVFANWLRGFGLLVIIDHGFGYMSLYARNQSIYTKVGSQVSPSDIIATLGASGGYKEPSLYFEIRKNGIPINPRLWCR